MKVPTLHRNGSAQSDLLNQHREVLRTLGAATEALAKARPNGRDYEPQGPEAIAEAQREHEARQAKLRELYDEVRDLYVAISRGGHSA